MGRVLRLQAGPVDMGLGMRRWRNLADALA